MVLDTLDFGNISTDPPPVEGSVLFVPPSEGEPEMVRDERLLLISNELARQHCVALVDRLESELGYSAEVLPPPTLPDDNELFSAQDNLGWVIRVFGHENGGQDLFHGPVSIWLNSQFHVQEMLQDEQTALRLMPENFVQSTPASSSPNSRPNPVRWYRNFRVTLSSTL